MRTFWTVTLMFVLACGEKDHDTSDDSMESNTTSPPMESPRRSTNAEPSSLAEEFDYCGEFDRMTMVNVNASALKKILIVRGSKRTPST